MLVLKSVDVVDHRGGVSLGVSFRMVFVFEGGSKDC